jgi:hypothetical protein
VGVPPSDELRVVVSQQTKNKQINQQKLTKFKKKKKKKKKKANKP